MNEHNISSYDWSCVISYKNIQITRKIKGFPDDQATTAFGLFM